MMLKLEKKKRENYKWQLNLHTLVWGRNPNILRPAFSIVIVHSSRNKKKTVYGPTFNLFTYIKIRLHGENHTNLQ